MLISLLLFYFITSFLLILSSSVSIMIEKKCSTNKDCDHHLICHAKTKICTCPKPYFWHNEIHACSGCAPGWLDLETKKCLLFTVSHPPGVTWYEAETTCNALLAQPMIINNTNEFKALQHKIDSLINGVNTLSATHYFQHGTWIGINSEWAKSYTWCNNNKKEDFFDCVQIRQKNKTNIICLEYVSCTEQSHFICEASPVVRSVLEKNMAESTRSIINDRNKEITVRRSRQAQSAAVVSIEPAANQVMMTTKKSFFNFGSIANILTTGLTAFGHVSNAVGQVSTAVSSYYGAKQPNQQNAQQIAAEPAYMQMAQSMPQALASNADESKSNLLLYCGIGGGIILILVIIVICIVIFSKKTKSVPKSRASVRSTESDTSDISE